MTTERAPTNPIVRGGARLLGIAMRAWGDAPSDRATPPEVIARSTLPSVRSETPLATPDSRARLIIGMERRESRRRKWLGRLVVVGATLASLVYCVGFAAPMYTSSAKFAVRGTAENGGASVFGKISNLSGGLQAALTDGFAVRDYLGSPDALSELERRSGFVSRMKAPHGDLLNRLDERAPREGILDFYHRTVRVRYNMAEGIMALDVSAFTAKDAYEIASALTAMADEFSNTLNRKAVADTVRVARDELKNAEVRLSNARTALADWRKANDSLDVEASAKMVQSIIQDLEKRLADARGELKQIQNSGINDTPRRRSVEDRVRTLTTQIAQENARLTGTKTDGSIVNQLGEYQKLTLEQEFASKAYELAAQSMINAQMVANTQQKFVAMIVPPNLPEIQSWPDPFKVVPLTFIGAILVWLIGSLTYSVLRDNARV